MQKTILLSALLSLFIPVCASANDWVSWKAFCEEKKSDCSIEYPMLSGPNENKPRWAGEVHSLNYNSDGKLSRMKLRVSHKVKGDSSYECGDIVELSAKELIQVSMLDTIMAGLVFRSPMSLIPCDWPKWNKREEWVLYGDE